EIAAASKEQSTGVEEINKAVSQMDEMTQQNAALVEESAAAGRTLQEQAQNLHSRMSEFTIDAIGRAHERPVREVAKRPAQPVTAKTAPKVARMPVKKVAAGGGASEVAKLHGELESAYKKDAEWKEF